MQPVDIKPGTRVLFKTVSNDGSRWIGTVTGPVVWRPAQVGDSVPHRITVEVLVDDIGLTILDLTRLVIAYPEVVEATPVQADEPLLAEPQAAAFREDG